MSCVQALCVPFYTLLDSSVAHMFICNLCTLRKVYASNTTFFYKSLFGNMYHLVFLFCLAFCAINNRFM